MIATKLNHPGHEEDGTEVIICSVMNVTKKTTGRTAVLADRAPPKGVFRYAEMPLFDIYYNCGSAWVFITKPPFGYITPEQRLWLLLGHTILIGDYDVAALGMEPAIAHLR